MDYTVSNAEFPPTTTAQVIDPKPADVPVPHPWDLESVKLALKQTYEVQIRGMVERANAHQVTDDDSEKKAVEMASQAKKLNKLLDDQRKVIIADPDAFVRGVNGLCNSVFKNDLARIETTLKKRVADYAWAKEVERRKREKEQQEALAKLQKKMEKEAKKVGVEPPPMAPAPVEKKETTVRTESGTSSVKLVWRMTEIMDFSKVPDEYKELSTKAVNAAIKAGIRNIPGLKISEVPEMAIRTN